ncbi:hypothetical protein AKJ16_DCAP20269 [Drosera capensis]
MAETRREGDWECLSCKNNNYAFRTICNRCKQPRLLVDSNAAAPSSKNSKWLPRIGDWICSGFVCLRSRLARVKARVRVFVGVMEFYWVLWVVNLCVFGLGGWLVCVFLASFCSPWWRSGLRVYQFGSLACTNNNYASREKCNKCGQPKDAVAMPAIAVPGVYPRLPSQGVLQQSLIDGFRSQFPLNSSWPVSGSDGYGTTAAPSSLPGGSNTGDFTYLGTINRASPVPKGWRNGDWLCTCGFHNYSSRTECKNCKAVPPALGLKRLASDDHANDLDNKRLNAGSATNQYLAAMYPSYAGGGTNGQVPIGKGAKQWRDGDWMCTSCSNHNYASRSQCNRCKAEKSADAPASKAWSETISVEWP